MSDEIRGMMAYQGIDIPARFVRQALEHIETTGARYVTFLFTGDEVQDATCIGVSTAVPRRMPRHEPQVRPDEDQEEVFGGELRQRDLTQEMIVDVIRTRGPISVREIGDALGLGIRSDKPRQKIRRIVLTLVEAQVLSQRKGVDDHHPKFSIRKNVDVDQMPLRPAHRRIQRNDITDDMVIIEFMKKGRANSRTIGDALQIPRHDSIVRQKVSAIVRGLLADGRLRDTGERLGGGRIYEMIDEASAAVS